ncbi:FAD-dependent monooxygenase [Burkholderia plantarii]|uniref:Flavin-type monooxygenase n=1 Tax=Burkholderia plantarii TaxID=41899 RepID=A0A0B6RTK3_BURPL|nr:FAD-dependent monooxygenase [Burkholderia plantarii]AJK48677.1 flavin-type monooxygenase [Burkholderia plantarii]
MTQADVLIVGAGPTGLVLAIWLTKQGIPVRIVDKRRGPGETSRAMAVQARTLELYRQLDIADEVVAAGYKTPAMNMWARGKRKARIALTDAGEDISPYPFVLVFPQDKHERLLLARLRSLGVEVERETELVGFEAHDEHVVATLRAPDGREQTCQARFLAGCDGARSTIRHATGSSFEGGTYKQIFYVADVEASGVEPAGEAHIAFDKSDFVLVMAYGEPNRYRLIGTVQGEPATDPERLSFDDVGHRAIEGLGLEVAGVNWFSTYHVHHRVTERFRHGRVFLLGDAAHVHSPAGGQGMNTGIVDAINLAWKLSAVLKDQAPDALLDSYDTERRAFAHKLVETTDRVFSFATAEGGFADFVRTRIAPVFASVAYELDSVRDYMFRVVSQTMLDYRDGPLGSGLAGKVGGGDRLPFVRFEAGDNYGSLTRIAWQVHVYGAPSDELRHWCDSRGIALHAFAWVDAFGEAGLARDAAYLLRPDGHVGMAVPHGAPQALTAYVEQHGLRFGRD